MRWFINAMLAVAVVALVGCAAQAPRGDQVEGVAAKDSEQVIAENDSENKKKPDLVCEKVKRTGSHMTETFCYSRRAADRNRERAQDELRRQTRGGFDSGDGQ